MSIKNKSFSIKSVNDSGEVEGYFSTFDVRADSYGDRIAPGCFSNTISEWKSIGKYPPLVWNHNMDDPELVIGRVDDITEDEHGALMKAHFFDTPKAQAVRNLIKEDSVFQFSFAYSVNKERKPNEDEKSADPNIQNVLEDVSLMEVTITPTPANPLAQVTEIKSGRRNSAKDADKLKQIIQLAQECLGELDDTEEPESGSDEPKANETAVSKEQTEAFEKRKGALLATIKKYSTEVKS